MTSQTSDKKYKEDAAKAPSEGNKEMSAFGTISSFYLLWPISHNKACMSHCYQSKCLMNVVGQTWPDFILSFKQQDSLVPLAMSALYRKQIWRDFTYSAWRRVKRYIAMLDLIYFCRSQQSFFSTLPWIFQFLASSKQILRFKSKLSWTKFNRGAIWS